MEKKEKIFSKLNIKDYTNRLEKILEKKKFSLDTKNLLLSMLYKIENGYNDYSKTKIQVPNKNEFIQNIFNIINKKCNQIIVAEFDSQASSLLKNKNVKYIIDKEKQEIIAIANELLVFNCILNMQENEIIMPQEKQSLKVPVSNLLNIGNRINQTEVIRDFNGWSWDIVLKEIDNISVNTVFQTILYLTGYEFIQKWINNSSNLADYLDLFSSYLKENYGEKRANQFITLFCKLAIDISIYDKNEQYEFWKEKRDIFNQELEKLQDKENYISNKTKEKKEYTKQIEDIDKIINNKELLKEEYTKRNEKLPNKEKIFSISHLVLRLEKERNDFLEKIKQCNILIEPKGYVKRKHEVEAKVQFLNKLDIDKNQDIRNTIIQLCNIFLSCFEIKIAKAQTKQEVLTYIYELRYYGFLPLDKEGNTLKSIPKLQIAFQKCKKNLLEKARKLGVIDEITEDEKANFEIVSKIFDSKMIDLDHMIVEIKIIDEKLYVEYYDEKVLESRIQVQSDKTIKLKKKTKLFI